MKCNYNKRERLEILLDALRDSVFFRMQLAEQFADSEINFDIIKNDPAYDAALRIVRMYIKDERLLGWWLGDSRYGDYCDADENYICIESAADLIDYYRYSKSI